MSDTILETKTEKPVRKTHSAILLVEKLNEDAVLPRKANASDAGFDLCALEDTTLWFHKPKLIHTGISVKLPRNTVGDIRPRSSMNAKGVTTFFGTIDGGYTGELLVCMAAGHYKIRKGEKIAQLVVTPKTNAKVQLGNVTKLKTDRGAKGFGSSGRFWFGW